MRARVVTVEYRLSIKHIPGSNITLQASASHPHLP